MKKTHLDAKNKNAETMFNSEPSGALAAGKTVEILIRVRRVSEAVLPPRRKKNRGYAKKA